jgi:hypothetical protein
MTDIDSGKKVTLNVQIDVELLCDELSNKSIKDYMTDVFDWIVQDHNKQNQFSDPLLHIEDIIIKDIIGNDDIKAT